MTATETQPTTVELRPEVEPCPECGAQLARDQRYCLNCGIRRSEPRVEFRRLLGAAPAAAPSAQETARTAVASERPARDHTPLAAVGGIVVLGLMLLVGVLIGRGDDQTTTAAAPPQVVTLDEAATAGAEPEQSASAADKARDGSGSGQAKGGKGGGEKAAAGGGGLSGGGGGESTADPVEASDADLEALESTSPGDYSEASEELPDTIALPGEPPAPDNVEPGGGTSGTTIK